jgi:hypothetical protein
MIFNTSVCKITITVILLLFGIPKPTSYRFIKIVESLRNKSGLSFCISYMKTSRLHITRYICGNPLLSNSQQVSLKNGFPTKFLFLQEYIDSGNFIKIRGVLTLLNFTRSIIPTHSEELKIKPSFDSITDKYKGKDYSIPLYFINNFIKENKLSLPKPNFDFSLHYLSSKSSPFGKATITGPFALQFMIEFGQGMLNNFSELITDAKFKLLFGNFMNKLYRDHRLVTDGKVIGELGKFSIVKDPELKRRVIAMLDYNSQILLRPIHDGLLKTLKKLPCDRTFDQNPLNKWKPKGNKFWSLDLSSATDRFPINLQAKVISCLYNDRKFSEAWKNILIDRKFFYEGSTYKYSVGQPMGAYSS